MGIGDGSHGSASTFMSGSSGYGKFGQIDASSCKACGTTDIPGISQCQLVVQFPSWMTDQIFEGRKFTFCSATVSTKDDEICIDCTTPEAFLFLHPYGYGGIAEGFAGVGGWAVGIHNMCGDVRMAVEVNPTTAATYGKSHCMPVMTLDEAMESIKQGEKIKPCVLVGSILDRRTWLIAGLLDISIWVVSPPCPPWSSSGAQKGLRCEDGRLLTDTLTVAAQLGVRMVAMENVPHITQHDDFKEIKRIAFNLDMPLRISQVDECLPVLPSNRRRWMAIFISQSFCQSHHVSDSDLGFISAIKWPRILGDHEKINMTIGDADGFITHLSSEEQMELVPSEEIMENAKDPNLLPKWLRKPAMTAEEVLAARTITPQDVFRAIMASYGRQHEIPMEYQKNVGNHVFFVQVHPGEFLRLASPWELLSALGFQTNMVLPGDIFEAWTIAGNALSPVQSTLTCWRLHLILGPHSPFRLVSSDLRQMGRMIREKSIKFSCWKEHREGGWRQLVPVYPVNATELDMDISPTIPYDICANEEHCDELISSCVVAAGQPVLDANMLSQCLQECPGSTAHRVEKHVAWVIQHSEGHSNQAGWAFQGMSISQIIKQAFPSCKESDIDLILVGDQDVAWTHIPHDCQKLHIIVHFRKHLCHVLFEHQHRFVVEIDATWKVVDLKGYIAGCTGTLPSQLVLSQNCFHWEDEEAIVQGDDLNFHVGRSPIIDGRIRCVNKIRTLDQKPSHTDYCIPVSTRALRFGIRHPIWSTVRTCAAMHHETIQQLLQRLLPDFEPTAVKLVSNEEVLSWEKTIESIDFRLPLTVEFSTGTGIPIQKIEVLTPMQPYTFDEAIELQKIWIRSPFNHRAQPKEFPKTWSITRVAAAFFVATNSVQTLLCLGNSRQVDPRLTIADFQHDIVLGVRACPLPGGAKFEMYPSISSGENSKDKDEASDSQDFAEVPMKQLAVIHPITGAIHTHQVCSEVTLSEAVTQALHGMSPYRFFDVNTGKEIPELGEHAVIDSPHEFGMIFASIAGVGFGCTTSSVQPTKPRQFSMTGPFWNGTKFVEASPHDKLIQVVLNNVLPSKRPVVVTPMMNGIQLNPVHTMQTIDGNIPIRLRLAQLPGGTKPTPKNSVKSKLRSSLVAHGVPDSTADARVESVCSAVGINKLQNLDLDDPDQYWKALKKLASDDRVRLVTAMELKDYQKLKRANANVIPKSSGDVPKGGPNRDKFKIPPLDEIVICHQHFVAFDDTVTIIPASRFGPDAAGLAIMNTQEAMAHLGKGCISTEPLAILAIGHQVDKVGAKILIPGHTKDGQPLLLPGALVQFGEGNIEYKAAIPCAEAETIDAITMEFTIRRHFVAQWQATATPMHYLGLNCPELRGGKVISSWAIKTFDGSKTVPFNDATHWHGFLKVEFGLVPGILRRSGQNGIFFTPKGADKKPDQRFAVVALPNKKFDDIQAEISNIDGALGVAVLNRDFTTFGIRCFREKLDKLREFFFPETAKIDTADIQIDDNTFLLQNLQGQFTREGLNTALNTVGWNAQAIRQSGPQTWIIASQEEPPSQHLCINGGLAMVSARKTSGTAALVMTRTNVTTTVNVHAQGTDITKHSRVDELRADLSHQMEAYMDSKLSAANAQIQQLQHALEETKLQVQQSQNIMQQELVSIRADQDVTQQKVGEIETAVNASAGNIVSQMKEMLDMFHRDNGKQMDNIQTNIKSQISGMQDDLSKRIEYIEREQGKRHKSDHSASHS